jgi:hypothetical protein
MSDTDSNLVDSLDTDQILDSLDYGELFEGTALEGVDQDEDGIAEAIGRRLGEAVGRWLGEIVGARLGAIVVPALIGDGGTQEEDEEESDADEEESDADEEESDANEEESSGSEGDDQGSDEQEGDGNE